MKAEFLIFFLKLGRYKFSLLWRLLLYFKATKSYILMVCKYKSLDQSTKQILLIFSCNTDIKMVVDKQQSTR